MFLESSSSGQQRLRIIRVQASVRRIVFFRLAAPPNYSSAGINVPRIIFTGPTAPPNYSSAGVNVPRIIFIGPTASPNYSSMSFGPSNRLLQASSALLLFECGCYCPSNYSLRASSASTLFECGFRSLESHLSAVLSFYSDTDRCPSNIYFVLSMLSNCPKYVSNTPVRMPYVKYEDKSTVSNTRWPGICIMRALSRQFLCLQHEDMHRWTHRVPRNYWALTR
jgi:hypothetical protein